MCLLQGFGGRSGFNLEILVTYVLIGWISIWPTRQFQCQIQARPRSSPCCSKLHSSVRFMSSEQRFLPVPRTVAAKG
jgi:hypothetical protein